MVSARQSLTELRLLLRCGASIRPRDADRWVAFVTGGITDEHVAGRLQDSLLTDLNMLHVAVGLGGDELLKAVSANVLKTLDAIEVAVRSEF